MDNSSKSISQIQLNNYTTDSHPGLTESERNMLCHIAEGKVISEVEAGWILVRENINQQPHLFLIKMNEDVNGESSKNETGDISPAFVCCFKLDSL